MTKRGALTELDRIVLNTLTASGPSTTAELSEDLGAGLGTVYARLARLNRLGRVSRTQLGNSTPVLWSVRL